jgi:(p)ppGpp synthase/HD superfamily hydrolase
MTTTSFDLTDRTTLGAGALSTRFDEALRFAFERHRFHLRKGSRVPYLSHLMSVSALVLEYGGSESQAIAGLLHDAVEDAAPGQGPDVLQAIGEQFGESVRSMVAACSDSLNEDEHGKAP